MINKALHSVLPSILVHVDYIAMSKAAKKKGKAKKGAKKGKKKDGTCDICGVVA